MTKLILILICILIPMIFNATEIKYLYEIDTFTPTDFMSNHMKPCFLNNDSIVYFKTSKDIYKYKLSTKDKTKIDFNGIKFIVRKGDKIFLEGDKISLLYYNGNFIPNPYEDGNYLMFDNIYFNYEKGLIKKTENDSFNVVENNDENYNLFSSFPIFNNKNKNILYYFSLPESLKDYSTDIFYLTKNNLEKKQKSILATKVYSYSLIPSNKDYLLANIYDTIDEEFAPEAMLAESPDRPSLFLINTITGKKEKLILDKENNKIMIYSVDVNNDNNVVCLLGVGNKIIISLYKLTGLKQDTEQITSHEEKKQADISKTFYKSTANLRIRESADTTAKIVVTIPQGSKVELLEKGKADTINDIKGNWIKVKTDKNIVGWAFNGYLEEIK
jgi:hypothetical protein